MKKILCLFLCSIFGFCIAVSGGCNKTEKTVSDCVRIHIRANSNLDNDQQVKMVVVKAVVEYLTPLLADCASANDAKQVILGNIDGVEQIADDTLAGLKIGYTASAKLTVEEFPTRQYLQYVFPSGKYDALIIELGEASGDNWWCVAFPPLCFVPIAESDNFCYKSKIVEIIEKYFGGEDE
jgi:stage II sporulation protein R